MKKIKVPTILQAEAAECGAACLGMIFSYYGLWLRPDELREKCGVGRDGSKAVNILKAALGENFEAEGYEWTAKDLEELDAAKENVFPLIIYWEYNHFVILEGFEGDKVRLNDPAMGRRRVSRQQFNASYSEVALYIRPGKDFKPAGTPPNIIGEIWRKMRRDKIFLPLLALVNLFFVLPAAVLPLLTQIYIDNILTRQHPEWLPVFGVSVAVAGGLSALIVWLRLRILHNFEYRISVMDTAKDFWHLLNLPLSFFRHRYPSELAVDANVGASMAKFIAEKIAVVLPDFGVAFCYFIFLSLYNLPLAVIALTLNIISVAAFYLTQEKLRDITLNIQQNSAKEYGVLADGLRRLDVLRIGGGETDFFARWGGYHAKVLRDSQKATMISLPMNALSIILAGLNAAFVITLGGFSVMEGTMTAGMYAAFLNLTRSFRRVTNKTKGLASTWRLFTAQTQRRNDIIRTNTMEEPVESGEEFPGGRLSGEIELKNITFGYNKSEKPLLNDFNLHIKEKQRVALVGKSGNGKSTAAKIAAGLIEPWSGVVCLDGINRKNISAKRAGLTVATVDQDISFIRGTIAENVAMFDPTMRRSEIIRAAKDACIHKDILRLNGGYDAKMSEGGKNLSGGQRQRLEIARALAINPSLLILDEATCALDTVTEKQVLTNIRRRGCACLIVAHRLSTVKNCDEIAVMENGRIVERGTHKELMEKKGVYWELARAE